MATPNEQTQLNPIPVAEPTVEELLAILQKHIREKGLKMTPEQALKITAFEKVARRIHRLQYEHTLEERRLNEQKVVNEATVKIVDHVRTCIKNLDVRLSAPVAYPDLLTAVEEPTQSEVSNMLTEIIDSLGLPIKSHQVSRLDAHSLVKQLLKKDSEVKVRQAATEYEVLFGAMIEEQKALLPETPPPPKEPAPEPLWKRVALNKGNEKIENAKEMSAGLLPPDFFEGTDEQTLRLLLSGARGFLAGKRRNLCEFLGNKEASTLSQQDRVKLEEESRVLQDKINMIDKVYQVLYNAKANAKANYCPGEIFFQNRARYEATFGNMHYGVKAAAPAASKLVAKKVSAPAPKPTAKQPSAEELVRADLVKALLSAGCDANIVEDKSRRLMKKYEGSSAEILTQAAVGHGVLAETSSSPEDRQSAQQTAVLYARAADLDAERFQELVAERLAAAQKSADKPYAKPEKPLSANQARRAAEAIRKAKQEKKEKKNKK